ncbi:hypothetical protein KGF57_001811, partial [Candida theae]
MEPAHLYGRDPGYDMDEEKDSHMEDEFDDVDSNDWDFTVPKNEKESSGSDEFHEEGFGNHYDVKPYDNKQDQKYRAGRLNGDEHNFNSNQQQHPYAPYPVEEKHRDTDADSEFHF